MEKVQKKMFDLTKDFMNGLYYDREAFLDREAYELGAENGEKGAKLKMAKNLLITIPNLSFEQISQITNLSIEEIKKIEKDLN